LIEEIEFVRVGRLVVEGRFDGCSMTSDVGAMLLCQTDREHQLAVPEFGIGTGKRPRVSRLPRKKHLHDGEVTLDADGFSQAYRQGDAFFVPKGFRGYWRQTQPDATFGYGILGAGSAGSVLARRPSEGTGVSVPIRAVVGQKGHGLALGQCAALFPDRLHLIRFPYSRALNSIEVRRGCAG
jgi:hypothetical protein